MEAVLMIGLPGSGKSSFYRERFFTTHVRISLDLLKTRYREQLFLQSCLESGQKFVIDNTNPTRSERAVYISSAKGKRFRVAGYYFQSQVADCQRRNGVRPESERVPDVAIFATAKKLELPNWDEGFDALSYVRITGSEFVVEDWQDDI